MFNVYNGRNFVSHILGAKGLAYASTLPVNRNTEYSLLYPSAYVSVGYDWKGYLGISATVEADAMPRFVFKNTVSIRPAVDGYIDLSKLLNINRNILSDAKITSGWGKSGRSMFVPYEWFEDIDIAELPEPEAGTELFYEGMETLATSEWHLGGTLGFLDDRIKLSMTYYNRMTEDIFTVYNRGGNPVNNKGTTYLKYVDAVNVFERTDNVINRGLEVDMAFDIIRRKNIGWTISLNGAYNDNNYPLGRVVGYECDGAGNLIDMTGEGRLTEEDRIILGRTIPLFTGGLNTKLDVGNFSFMTSLTAAAGHVVPLYDADADGMIIGSELEQGSFIRMNNIGINYHFPLKVKWMKAVGVRLSARNPFTISRSSIPHYSSVVLGVSLTF